MPYVRIVVKDCYLFSAYAVMLTEVAIPSVPSFHLRTLERLKQLYRILLFQKDNGKVG